MSQNKKGDRRERELVNFLDEYGFAVLRAPASGSATERELPDALAGNGKNFYAIEAKSSGGDPIYIEEYEIVNLEYFANNFGAKAKVGVKFDLEHGDPAHGEDDKTGWYFFDPDDLYRTDSGNYRVKKETALSDGVPLRRLGEEDEDDE